MKSASRDLFYIGDELTSGKPDQKEGIYFGAELLADQVSQVHTRIAHRQR